jgi:hypothetical protein
MDTQAKDILFKALSGLVGVLTIVVIYVAFFGPLGSYTHSLYYARTVNVSASDKVTIKPDIANISFSVVTEGKNISSITDDNNSKVNSAIAMLKQNGVEEKDIKTIEYSLSPVYTQPGQYSIDFVASIAKYTLTQTVSVKIRDFSKISAILDSLTSLGINRIGNIAFGIDEPEKYLSQAREGAFKKAQEKAAAIAQQNGLKVGKVVSVSEYGPVSYGYEGIGGMGGASMAPKSMVSADIQPGSQEVTANVSVTYEIR